MADAQDVDVVADNFVANDIRVDERPLTEIIADGTSFTGEFPQAAPSLEETRCDEVRLACPTT